MKPLGRIVNADMDLEKQLEVSPPAGPTAPTDRGNTVDEFERESDRLTTFNVPAAHDGFLREYKLYSRKWLVMASHHHCSNSRRCIQLLHNAHHWTQSPTVR